MGIFDWLYVIAMVLLLFGAAIFVHEFGHFIVARLRGMKVEAFAIGFGPKIFGWTRDGIEYSVRWIPAGGFVKLPQMITSEALEGGQSDEAPIPPASPFSKILVAVAGPLMNVVFAIVIACGIYVVGLPKPVNPSIIGYVDPNSPEAAMGIEENNRIVSIDGEPVSTWQDVQRITALSRSDVLTVGIEQQGRTNEFRLQAEISEVIGLKLLNLGPQDQVIIAQVMPDSPAQAAGLQADDLIVKFDSVPIFSHEQLIDLIGRSAEKTAVMEVERGEEMIALEVTPKLDPALNVGRIGVQLTSSAPVYLVQKPGPTPWAQIEEVWDQTVSTIAALVHHKETGVGAKDLSGPVGILSVLAINVNTDYRLALSFLVLLNINLAILNLLPIPVLDGGHIMMALFELIFRRQISARIQEYATAVFAILLISFMIYVTYFDIGRISLFRALFKDSGTVEQVETGSQTPAPAEP